MKDNRKIPHLVVCPECGQAMNPVHSSLFKICDGCYQRNYQPLFDPDHFKNATMEQKILALWKRRMSFRAIAKTLGFKNHHGVYAVMKKMRPA